VLALEKWPETGIPDRPGAWLMTAAKRRGIDALRKRSLHDRREAEIARETEERLQASIAGPEEELQKREDDPVGDDLLRLIFIACHPVLTREARAALTLRLLGGLSTAEIARAFLAEESAIAQRIVRAKKALAEARAPFEAPRGAEVAERLSSVLEVIYLIFNEGYAATAGDDWMRPGLCDEATRLGRVLTGLLPNEPEVHGLVALMELHASRFHARTKPDGTPVLLLEQNRARWDRLLIGRGLDGLKRAERLAGDAPGPYALQAAIAACHARARTAGETDWARIARLYADLGAIQPSPVIELNRAMAVGMSEGPASALAILDALASEPALEGYHLLPAARGDMLERAGRRDEARAEFARAARLATSARERERLTARSKASESS
jgi:predicted RNA polymerase sigma factor